MRPGRGGLEAEQRVALAGIAEDDGDRHVHPDLGQLDADDIGHHPRPLFQLNIGDDVRERYGVPGTPLGAQP
jgi:hypothetical protein